MVMCVDIWTVDIGEVREMLMTKRKAGETLVLELASGERVMIKVEELGREKVTLACELPASVRVVHAHKQASEESPPASVHTEIGVGTFPLVRFARHH